MFTIPSENYVLIYLKIIYYPTTVTTPPDLPAYAPFLYPTAPAWSNAEPSPDAHGQGSSAARIIHHRRGDR